EAAAEELDGAPFGEEPFESLRSELQRQQDHQHAVGDDEAEHMAKAHQRAGQVRPVRLRRKTVSGRVMAGVGRWVHGEFRDAWRRAARRSPSCRARSETMNASARIGRPYSDSFA